jgi:hypothetical protein
MRSASPPEGAGYDGCSVWGPHRTGQVLVCPTGNFWTPIKAQDCLPIDRRNKLSTIAGLFRPDPILNLDGDCLAPITQRAFEVTSC